MSEPSEATPNLRMARRHLEEKIEEGLRKASVDDDHVRHHRIVNSVVDRILSDNYLISDRTVRLIQEVQFGEQTDESRSYTVYTEPDS